MTYSRCYAMGDDGKFYEIEGFRNISISTKDNEETHDVDFAKKLTGELLTFTFKKLDNRKDRTTWSKIFMMPKWEATEFCFPKKKKRGTMRRRRRERRANEKYCRDCQYGAQDSDEWWYCTDFGCRIGDKDGSGFCSDAERRTDANN